MDYAIIAAGEGERLKAEGCQSSKPLIQVEGKALIERALETCISNGADSISCIINEQSKDLLKYLSEYNFPVKFNLIVKSTPSSLHSLYALKPYLMGKSFLLMTTDSVFRENEFREYLNFINEDEATDGVLAVTDYIDDEKPLYAEIDLNGRIKSFSDDDDSIQFVTGGIYYFRKDIFAIADEVLKSGTLRLRNFLKKLTQSEFKLAAYEFSKIIDVDHISDVEKAEKFLRQGR
jgi:NDP-sugar pyrophosphorylase family protein